MKTYLFNVQTTVRVTAETEEEARDQIGAESDSVIITDNDIMLVEVTQ